MTGVPMYREPASRAQTLAADADREHAVTLLKTAFTEGRLTKDEYDDRLGDALTARTYADLDAVTAGLPRPGIAAPRSTNSLAIASLCCGIGQVILWPLATIPAIVLGHVARRQIRRTGQGGAGLALAGLLLGWLGLTLAILVALGTVWFVVAVAHNVHGFGGGGHAVRVPTG